MDLECSDNGHYLHVNTYLSVIYFGIRNIMPFQSDRVLEITVILHIIMGARVVQW